MLKPQLRPTHSSLSRRSKAFSAVDTGCGTGGGTLSSLNKLVLPVKHQPVRVHRHAMRRIKAVAGEAATTRTTSVKAVITVRLSLGSAFSNIGISRALDDITDMLGKSLLLELVAAELDPKTGSEKPTLKDYAYRMGQDLEDIQYLAEFEVPEEFGELGAVFVENEHHKEMFVETIVIDGFPNGPISVFCDSWVQSKFDNPEKRVFFTSKSFLPSRTPTGIKSLREKELATLRGEGAPEGPRKKQDRIYDYDTYNDLGDPDKNLQLARPVLGTKDLPYPRRCKTGRPRTKSDPLTETRTTDVYVPRDEVFSELKNATFQAKTLYSVLHAVVPSLEMTLLDKDLGFPYFTAIDSLYNEGVNLPQLEAKGVLGSVLPRLLKFVDDMKNNVLLFETPELVDRDKFSWMRDEGFCRQAVAGLNPLSIRLVTEWPLMSNLDPEVYGPPESAITTEIVEEVIRGFTTLDEAIKQKKIFVLDYHDIFLPYVNKVREIKEMRTTLYGSRTLMYLTPTGTLRPIAIELVRPPCDGKPQWKRAFTPCWNATDAWLWKLAKIHALAHDTGYHQLVSHWLRTHCCTEPYIIAANRQLSHLHPIYRLLHPHFRYTMEINAMARESLINCGGVIESCFSPGRYSIELSAVAYGLQWRFDHEGLPADLISRGLAEEDPDSPHGLKLAIEDYPYANDGLLLWDAIKGWVTDYVNHYYPEPDLVKSDEELQAWWTEVRTMGHADKKDEPWWPVLDGPEDLIGVLTTIIWVTSGHHAAVNFGQYDHAGYIPNRSTIARVKMPCEDPTDEEWETFKRRPEDELLSAFPSQIQASQVMSVLDVLSSHSPDEEYLGETMEGWYEANPQIRAAYEIFAGRLKELEGIIDARNADPCRLNRSGAGVLPYNLLKPVSGPGVTGMGVPNSISI